MDTTRPRKIGRPAYHPLKRARKLAAMTLRELSEASGVDFSTISKIESGRLCRLYVGQLYKLAQALGVEWWTLVAPQNLEAEKRGARTRNQPPPDAPTGVMTNGRLIWRRTPSDAPDSSISSSHEST